MKRFVGPVAGLVALLLLVGVAAAKMDDKEWDSVKKDLINKINAADLNVKATAIGPLGDADRREAVLLLLGLLKYVDDDAVAQEEERDKNLKALEKMGVNRPSEANAARAFDSEHERLAKSNKTTDEKLAADRDVHFKVIEALAKTTDADAIKSLSTTGLTNKEWSLRAGVAEVFGYVKNADATQALLDAFPKEHDPRAKMAFLDSFGKLNDPRAVPLIAKALTDESWQVRAAAADGLAKSKSKDAVEPLISALEKEQSPHPKSNLIDALTRLTGETWGADVATWKKWWGDNKDKWAGPKEAPKVASAGGGPGDTKVPNDFFGVPIDSDHIVFILDISGSMNDEYERKGATSISSGPGKQDAGPEAWKGPKIEAAKKELIKTIKKLDPKCHFNIIFFNSSIEKWKDNLLIANQATKDEAVKYVEKQTANAQTDVWDALELAFKMAGMGLNDKSYKSGVDTIYLLSDGSPYPPDLFVGVEEIIKRAKEYNKLKKCRIHTIGFGDQANMPFLERLSKDSGGKSVKR